MKQSFVKLLHNINKYDKMHSASIKYNERGIVFMKDYIRILEENNQDSLLRFIDKLDDNKKKDLIKQIEETYDLWNNKEDLEEEYYE